MICSLFRWSLTQFASLALCLTALLMALGGCMEVEAETSPLDAGPRYDGEVMDLAGTWEVRPNLSGDCPHEIVGQPLGGLMRWSQDGAALELQSLENNDSLTLIATGYDAFSEAEEVSLLGCSAQARLQLDVDELDPPLLRGSYTASYVRTPGSACSGDEQLPVACEQRIDFIALAR